MISSTLTTTGTSPLTSYPSGHRGNRYRRWSPRMAASMRTDTSHPSHSQEKYFTQFTTLSFLHQSRKRILRSRLARRRRNTTGNLVLQAGGLESSPMGSTLKHSARVSRVTVWRMNSPPVRKWWGTLEDLTQ